jgi:GT2 family glycosyltransferase
MERLVSIVVVTWNSAPFLPRCLDGIRQQTHRDIELIAVDNASSDDSVALLRDAKSIIRNETNAGFARAANQAIAVARGEFVLLLNPDAYLTPEYVERLIAAMQDDSIGAATGKLIQARGAAIEPTGAIDSMGIRMTRTGRHFDIHDGATDDVFGVSGAAALYRMSFVRDVSIDGEFFDEDFFAYREDADVAWRGRLFGWRAIYVPDAVAYHVRSVTPERRRELSPLINMHSVKNRFLLRLKNEGAYLALRNAPFELFRDFVTIAAVLTIERTSMPALRWLWTNRKRILAKRREIQRRRKVSDRELARWFR